MRCLVDGVEYGDWVEFVRGMRLLFCSSVGDVCGNVNQNAEGKYRKERSAPERITQECACTACSACVTGTSLLAIEVRATMYKYQPASNL